MSDSIKTGQVNSKAGQEYNPESGDFQDANALDSNYTESRVGKFISDRYNKSYPIKKYVVDGAPQELGEGVKSLINRYSLFQYKGMLNNNFLAKDYYDLPDSKLHTDNILLKSKVPNTSTIIETFNQLGRVGLNYSWSDFLYTKYHKKIPNNYMITIRRFPFPCMDNLFDPATYDHKTEQVVEIDQPELARAVTWMSEATENPLENFLSWSNGFTWKDIESEVQVMTTNNQGIGGSSILGMSNTGLGPGAAVRSVATQGSGQNQASAAELRAREGFDPIKETFPNHTEGPYNVIKNMIIRDQGLKYEHNFDIKLHYNLQSHGRINPKMAFLDVISNLLVLTYNNAPFWGGAARWVGNGKFGSPLGDHSKLAAGDLGGFLKSLADDAGGLLSNVFGDGEGGYSLESFLGGMGDVAGDMLGGFLSKNLNDPQAPQITQAFLSGEPTGQWHITIGNPMNPIIMMGNLILDDSKFRLHGPLGRDDFPTELEVTLSFKHGRPRDKSEIERMFNSGRGRLYYAPEDFPDVLNNEGREPNYPSGTEKELSDYETQLHNPATTDNQTNEGIEQAANETANAANKVWAKLRNVASNVTEG